MILALAEVLRLKQLRQADYVGAASSGFGIASQSRDSLALRTRGRRAAGFPGRVVYGLLTSSFYSTLVGVHLPGKRALLDGIDIEFKSPAFIGDRLTVTGEIAFLNDTYHRLELKARIQNADGKLISKAKIRAGVVFREGREQ